MKSFIFLIILTASFSAFGQINIRIPKVGQPKSTPTPAPKPNTSTNNTSTDTGKATKTEAPITNNGASNSSGNPSVSSDNLKSKPEASDNPVLLKTTLDVRADLQNRYWKVPTESNYTSWIPQVRFKVFYKGDIRLRYSAEYFTPDGKSWFSETLEPDMVDQNNQTVEIKSTRVGDKFTNRSTNAVGTYGVKITNTRDNSVVFQGKFKINKYKYGPNIPMFKNQFCFYVEQDWNIPIGYVWLKWTGSGGASPLPTVSMWFKDDIRSSDLEARLFYNGQQIATTDDKGESESTEYRIPNVQENKELTYFRLWNFAWYKVRYAHADHARKSFREAKFINDMDGEYVVKVLFQGQQVREVKFSVSGGNIADNGIAKQNNFAEHKVIVPVKVMGTNEKWNPASWKTDAFYGNPLNGFNAQ